MAPAATPRSSARCRAWSGSAYRLLATGQLSLDVGVGRRVRPLGPLSVRIAAPREVVFDVIADPYLGRTPGALRDKVEVLERGSDMVVAAHRTAVGWGMTTTTVESVRFARPDTILFRLLRGPIPHVVETFALTEDDDGTTLHYSGEMGTDFWQLGRVWGDIVAPRWVHTVAESFETISAEAERRGKSRSSNA